MKEHFIKNVKNPDLENDAASKRYVDTRVKFYLPLDGTEKMTENLDMNEKQIKKIEGTNRNNRRGQ